MMNVEKKEAATQNQVSGIRCQERLRGEREKRMMNVENTKTATQKLGAGSWKLGAGGKMDQVSVTRSRRGLIAQTRTDLRTPISELRPAYCGSKSPATDNQKVETSLPATQKIEARFEQVRAQILAQAAFFTTQGTVETTWRTYRGRRLGPYFRVSCRQRRVRPAPCTGAVLGRTSIYLGRSPELAARVRRLLDELQQPTRCKRRCAELGRQVRRSLAHAKEELRQLLAQHGVELKGFEFRGAARAFGRLAPMSQLSRERAPELNCGRSQEPSRSLDQEGDGPLCGAESFFQEAASKMRREEGHCRDDRGTRGGTNRVAFACSWGSPKNGSTSQPLYAESFFEEAASKMRRKEGHCRNDSGTRGNHNKSPPGRDRRSEESEAGKDCTVRMAVEWWERRGTHVFSAGRVADGSGWIAV